MANCHGNGIAQVGIATWEWENYWILREYHKYILSTFTWIVGLSINLISGTLVHYSQKPQILFLAKTTLKLGPTVLFTYLKIILLQYFQFSIISNI